MRKTWLWMILVGLSSCGSQLEIAPDVALRHEHDAAFQRQVQLLQAEHVKVSATASGAGPALLTLEIINPRTTPEQHPDTLKQRVRKLAHLLVLDLASPSRYQVVSAQATFKGGFFSPSSQSSSQAFIYPIASLR